MTLENELSIVPPATLATMPTKVLLGRLRRLLRCEESASVSDLDQEELSRVTGILFKDTPEWRSAYAELKAALAEREHVPKGRERAAARLGRAKAARSVEHVRRR